jgi:cytochrome c-type biogenesis protein CcmE
MNGKLALVVSISIVLIALGFLVYTGLTDNMVYYYHVDEFLSKAPSLSGEIIKVNGKVLEGSIQRNRNEYGFVIHGSPANRMNVQYQGAVPDTFKDGCDVVVEGKYDSRARVFHATNLLAKCPTKYEPKQTGQKVAGTSKS